MNKWLVNKSSGTAGQAVKHYGGPHVSVSASVLDRVLRLRWGTWCLSSAPSQARLRRMVVGRSALDDGGMALLY